MRLSFLAVNGDFICFYVTPETLICCFNVNFSYLRISSETSTEINEIDPDASTSKLMLSADFFLLGVSFKDTYFIRLR